MADKNNNNGGLGDKNTPSSKTTPSKISLVNFCDANGVNPIDRNAVYMKYGKLTQKIESEWVELLKGKITLKK